MAVKYTQISEGRRARVQAGYLYVEQTNMGHGMLEQGGYAERVYRIPYSGTLEDAQVPNEWGVADIDRCIESGEVVRPGRLIE